MPDLFNIPDHELIAELERRGTFSRLVQFIMGLPVAQPQPFKVVTAPLQDRRPATARFFPNSDRKLPAGTTEVLPVPGRANHDGTPLHVATIGKDLQDRLTATPESLKGVDEEGRTGKFIVKGDERRALAQSFIDSWTDEIRLLEQRLEGEVLAQEEIESIHRQIEDLQTQIAIRRESAFGGMSYEEVMARNAADNGPGAIQHHMESKPGTPGVGVKWDFPCGVKCIDDPKRVSWDIRERPEVLVRLKALVPQDPCLGHLDKPVTFGESGAVTSVQLLADPVVFMRLLGHTEQVYKELRLDRHAPNGMRDAVWEWGSDAIYAAKDHKAPPPKGLTAVEFCSAWTDYFKHRMGLLPKDPDGHVYRSLKRQIRIWNPDFQEMQAPDFMYEESQLLGNPQPGERVVESRPHVNANDAWKETPSGPGVFKMSPPAGRTFGRKPE